MGVGQVGQWQLASVLFRNFSIVSSARKQGLGTKDTESRLVLCPHNDDCLKIVAARKNSCAVSQQLASACTSNRRHARIRRSPLDDPRSVVWNLRVHLIGSMDISPGTGFSTGSTGSHAYSSRRFRSSSRTTSKARPRAFHSFSLPRGSSETPQT